MTVRAPGARSRLSEILHRLQVSFGPPLMNRSEADDERAQGAALILATTLLAALSVLWSAVYWLAGRPLTAAIPAVYVVVTALSLALLRVSRRIGWYRISQILLILVLPVGVQASLGGFEQGSAVVIWAFLPVMGSLIFHGRYAFAYLTFYFVALVGLAAGNAWFRAAVDPLPADAVSVLWIGNIGGVSLVVFVVMRRFIEYVKQQRALAQDALATTIVQAKELAVARDRLEREVEVARRIQLAMLPRQTNVTGLEIATRMDPADEVGGDYFDILPVEGGCWIGVGDVSGHGLTAGLIMLMVQSIVATLVESDPGGPPASVVGVLNRVLFDNVHHRLLKDDFVTFSLLRYSADGRIELAGAHEPILIRRARTGRCDVVQTPGTWLAIVRELPRASPTTSFNLEPGDVLVLHTDGITEATSRAGEQFGIERLSRVVEEASTETVEQVRDRVFDAVKAWEAVQVDDATLLVLRFHGAVDARRGSH